MDEYEAISKSFAQSLATQFCFNKDSIVKNLLLKRKRIIHKASNKILAFKNIISELTSRKKEINYTFVYAPEGASRDSFIDLYQNSASEIDASLITDA